jgi:polyisoprenoid-binding protein YceI
MTATHATESIDLPAPGTWRIDPGHTEVGFMGRHFMLTKVRGRFTGVTGTITLGERPEDAAVDVRIDMATVTSGDDTRDDHLRSADLFDVAAHPTATFRSTDVRWHGQTGQTGTTGTTGEMTGDLTIKGVTRPVTLAVDYLGHLRDPWGSDRAIFSASGRVNREDWGVTWNMPLETGGLLVSKEIELTLEIEAVHDAPA